MDNNFNMVVGGGTMSSDLADTSDSGVLSYTPIVMYIIKGGYILWAK